MFGVKRADFEQLAVLCWIALGQYPNAEWTERVAKMYSTHPDSTGAQEEER